MILELIKAYLYELSDIVKKLKALDESPHNKSKKGRRDQNNPSWSFPSTAGQKLDLFKIYFIPMIKGRIQECHLVGCR